MSIIFTSLLRWSDIMSLVAGSGLSYQMGLIGRHVWKERGFMLMLMDWISSQFYIIFNDAIMNVFHSDAKMKPAHHELDVTMFPVIRIIDFQIERHELPDQDQYALVIMIYAYRVIRKASFNILCLLFLMLTSKKEFFFFNLTLLDCIIYLFLLI